VLVAPPLLQVVTCNRKNKDQYGREVAVCKLGGLDLNGWLVENGYAVAYKCVEWQEGGRLETCACRNTLCNHQMSTQTCLMQSQTGSVHDIVCAWHL
jgi:hypothetical protein